MSWLRYCEKSPTKWVPMVGEDHKTSDGEFPAPSRLCSRCGGSLKLELALDKTPGQPPYQIFRCIACGLLDWVAQPI